MDWIRILLSRVAAIFRRRKLDADLDEELRAHIDFATDEYIQKGLPPAGARTAALRAFGGVTQTRETYRVQRGIPFLQQFVRDVRFAFRQLRNSPGFAITSILTLALGIGATAAMLSVIDAVVLRPLPYRNVDRIVEVETHSANFLQYSSWPGYLGMRRQNSSFQALAGYAPYWGMTLKAGDQTQYVHVTQGTDNFFDVFGVRPLLGRTFLPGEDAPGKNNVVVLGYEVWRQSFHADRQITGKIVNLDGSPYEVIGIMPAGFRFPLGQPNLVYIPMHVRPNWVSSWRDHWLLTIGLLKSGVTIQQTNANMSAVMNELRRQQPETDSGRTAQLLPITQAAHGESELPEVWFLLGAVLAVLLLACINVAGLLMAQGIAREREMALRIAVGAARAGLVRQLLVENALLGVIGATTGLAIAAALLAAIRAFLVHAFMRGANVSLDLRVVAVTLIAGMISSIGAGLFPALRASRSDPNRSLKSGISAGTSQSQLRLRAGFVSAQVALSLVLVVFSSLLLLTLQRMLRVDFGFNPRNLLMLGINIPAGDYKGRDYVKTLLTPLEERVQTIPGVAAAGFIDQPPVLGFGSGTSQQIVGQPPDPPDHERNSESRSVTPGYYAALGLSIVRGRAFSSQDTPATQPVVIVNQAWVKEFLTPQQDPVAQSFVSHPNMAIIGVARDARQNLPDPARPEIDFPFSQWSQKSQQDAGSISVCLFVRTNVPPTSIIPQLREALHDIAPAIAFQTPDTMDDLLDDALVTNRMESWLFGIFASIAVLLAVIGIHGLLAQESASRTRDIGVRMALGATRTGIARMMFARIAALLVIGLLIGAFLTVLLSRVVASVLVIQFERDGAIIALLAVSLALVGFLAALIPIRRAASIDPMRALRTE